MILSALEAKTGRRSLRLHGPTIFGIAENA